MWKIPPEGQVSSFEWNFMRKGVIPKKLQRRFEIDERWTPWIWKSILWPKMYLPLFIEISNPTPYSIGLSFTTFCERKKSLRKQGEYGCGCKTDKKIKVLFGIVFLFCIDLNTVLLRTHLYSDGLKFVLLIILCICQTLWLLVAKPSCLFVYSTEKFISNL